MTSELIQQFREHFDYDPVSGYLVWKRRGYRSKIQAGVKAGCLSGNGYLQTRFNLRRYANHFIIFCMMEGRAPVGQIDHIDRNPLNNSWENLREATPSQNQANRVSSRLSKTGFKGVHLTPKGRFQALITKERKTYYLGTFDSAHEAAAAYRRKSVELWGEFHVA